MYDMMRREKILQSVTDKNIAPCKGCVKRYVGCHGSCSEYNEWKKLIAEEKTKLWSKYVADNCGSLDERRRYKGIGIRRKGKKNIKGNELSIYVRSNK